MLYVVYIPKSPRFNREALVAVFLMEGAAKEFVRTSVLTNLEVGEVLGAWDKWADIRHQAFGEQI
jgi:hypothetical protein